MMIALFDIKNIVGDIFANHIPGFTFTADTQAMTLADGVVHGAIMPAFVYARQCAHFTGLRGKVAREKRFEIAFADKADAG